ncbi:major facilitator superfamily domain-containing protein [Cladochytrium replicatum]|nr:major facilitator superfamily domain-containing protein [Cladochytrium replicatum]
MHDSTSSSPKTPSESGSATALEENYSTVNYSTVRTLADDDFIKAAASLDTPAVLKVSDDDETPKDSRPSLENLEKGEQEPVLIDEEGDSHIDPPPDGGYGWVVVFASFMTHVIVLGIQYSWGVYQSYFLLNNTFNTSQTVLSFVGTLAAGGMPLFGIPSGRLAERFGFRTMMTIGSIILVVALVIASFATEVWHLLLTQGLMFGIGSSFTYFPAVSLPSQWFDKKRSVATGIAVAGSGIGGFIFSNVVGKLLVLLDFRWTLRIMALIILVVMGVVLFLVKARIPPKPHSSTNWGMFKDLRFALLFIMGFLATFGYMIPFVYIPSYGVKVIGLSQEQGSLILSITNFGSAVGRVMLGMGADQYVGKINMLTLCMFLSSVCILLWWPFTNSFGTLLSFGFVNTFFSGGFISMFPVVIADLFGVERMASVMGMLYTASAVGNFAGSPLAGVIIESKGWVPAILYAGFLTLSSVIFLLAVRFTVSRKILARV